MSITLLLIRLHKGRTERRRRRNKSQDVRRHYLGSRGLILGWSSLRGRVRTRLGVRPSACLRRLDFRVGAAVDS